MNSRTKELNKLKRKFHSLFERCLVCGKTPIDMAHLIGRNVTYKDDNGKEKNDPTSIDNVFPLCRIHHSEYDKNTNSDKRIEWLIKKGLIQYSDRLKKIVNNY